MPSWVPAKRGDHEPVSILPDVSKASKDEQGSEMKRKPTIDFNAFDREFKEQNLKNKSVTTETDAVANAGTDKEQEHMPFTILTTGAPTVIFHTVRREAQESNPQKKVVSTQNTKPTG